MTDIVHCVDQDEVALRAARDAEALIQSIQGSEHGGVSHDGIARIVLTGGGAGIQMLRQLQHETETGTALIDWSRVHVFFGDERWVPADDPERNDKQAKDALLNKVDIPQENVHCFPAPAEKSDTPDDAELERAAADYAETITEFAPNGFDLHLLGMGPEGHINSLFPGTSHVSELERDVVVVKDCPKPPPTRLSLTLPAVGRSTEVWLLVAGEAKAEAAAHVAAGANANEWPGAGAHGIEKTVLYVDALAAKDIPAL